jgi:hypothetical protein
MKVLTQLATVFALAIPALAQNPHFIQADATLLNSGSLRVSWKEAGLGSNVLVSYTASANATAVYACINKGGKNPQASNKQTFEGPVSASGTFSSGKNGSISASLTIPPPGPGDFSCPGGQNLVLASVEYRNVAINDVSNNVSEPIPGTFSRVIVPGI